MMALTAAESRLAGAVIHHHPSGDARATPLRESSRRHSIGSDSWRSSRGGRGRLGEVAMEGTERVRGMSRLGDGWKASLDAEVIPGDAPGNSIIEIPFHRGGKK